MPNLTDNLVLGRCPHCAVASPNLQRAQSLQTNNHDATWPRLWGIYVCRTCGGIVSAWAKGADQAIAGHFPSTPEIDSDIPERPREYLRQASESLHAPAGAVMLAASAVDAMLQAKGYVDGTLYGRIDKAAKDNAITADMAAWAHNVRLDANDQRHADQAASLPTEQDAARVLAFATTLAEIMFVLPSRVTKGLKGED